MATIFIFYLIITIDKNLYVIYNILYNQGVFIMENEKENNKVNIKPFIILFLISIVIFAIMYFLHSKNIENRFNRTLQNYEKSINLIFENAITNKGSNENIYSAKEDLKLSFEIGFKMIESSMNEIMKNSNDILQFWFAFLSVIMIVFTIIGFFLNNNILNQAREQLKMIKREAKEETNKLIEENNKNISITNLFNLSNQAYYSGNYNSSINFLTEIIKIYEDDFKNEKYDEKSDSYDKAIKNCADAYNNRGNAKANLGNYKHSIKDYNKAIELNPNYSKAYYNRGLSKYNLAKENKNNRDEYNKLINEAIKDYDEAIKLDNNNLDAYNNRGLTRYYLAKENKNNRDKYNKLINEAIKDYDKTIEINKNYSNAYCNRGLAKYDLARLNKENEDKLINEAIEDYNKAIELNSQFAEAYYNRGLAKLQLRKIEEAIKNFIKSYELDNNDGIKEKAKNQLINLAQKGYNEAREFCKKYNINYNDNKK